MRESDLLPLYTAQVRAHVRDAAVDQPVLDFLRPLPPGIGTLNRMLALEQRFFLADLNLTYTDKMSMAAGVESACRSWTSTWLSSRPGFRRTSSSAAQSGSGS